MKLCILIDGISNSGGTDRVASLISGLFTSNGVETTIYSLMRGSPFYEFSQEVNIVFPKRNNRITNLIDFCFAIKKINYDAVIIISMGKLSAQAVPLLRLMRIRAKIICNDHVSIKSFSSIKKIVKWPAYILSDKVVVLTESDKKFLSRHLGEKVRVVRNCSPYQYDTFEHDRFLSKEKIVLAVGRLTYQKNFQRLLKIWKKIKTNGWKLVIVGQGDQQNELEAMIRNENISDITLEKPDQNIRRWYEKASLIAMTSRYEGLPMVLIEAKNFGIPAIAFNCPTGPDEIITNDGYVIGYDDDTSFEVKLQEVIDDDELRAILSKNAADNARNFSGEKIYQEWMSVLI